ncbi:MAG TPA: DUF721 domain-containing protein [Bryobacteraceae bacterium]|nr:DUF721 domain-containing protein [Bryobacteraceae bacterium]
MDQASRIIARSLLGESGGNSDIVSRESVACRAWKRAVGPKLAKRTKAMKLVRETLVVEVEDEIWRNNLWGFRKQILANLEKALGPGLVRDVEFRIMPPRREPERAAFALGQMGDEASEIADPGLRRNYRRARDREAASRRPA